MASRAVQCGEIAEQLGAILKSSLDRGKSAQRLIHGINTLEEADPDEIALCNARRYWPAIEDCKAGAILIVEALFESTLLDLHPSCVYLVLPEWSPQTMRALLSLFLLFFFAFGRALPCVSYVYLLLGRARTHTSRRTSR